MTYPNNPYPPQQPQQPGFSYPPQQPAPGYGEAQQPGYGGYPQQSQPGYPQQSQPGYPQQSQPGYPQQPAPGYGAPQPGYDAQQPAYGAPQPAYGAPQPGYGAPQPGYGAPQPAYGAPQPGYGYSPYGAGPGSYAQWGSRLGAGLIDGLIFALPGGLLQVIARTAGTEKVTCDFNKSTFESACTGGGLSAFGMIMMLLAVIAAIGGVIFAGYLEGTTGQTPGKKALNIRVVRAADGQLLGVGTGIGRRFAHIVDALPCYIGYFAPLWDEKKQTFADKIVSSVVVTTK